MPPHTLHPLGHVLFSRTLAARLQLSSLLLFHVASETADDIASLAKCRARYPGKRPRDGDAGVQHLAMADWTSSTL